MLQSDLVILRAIEQEDLRILWHYNNDLEVEIASGGDPPLPQSYERLLADYERIMSGGGRNDMEFAIIADGDCIGQCGLFNVNATARTCELGVTVGDKSYWGRGYGRESVRLLLDYAFVKHNMHKVWLDVHASKERALRTYQACGFVEEGRLRQHVWCNGKYDDLVIMGILREQWQSQ